MSGYRGTVVSERSAEETFDYLAEFSNAADGILVWPTPSGWTTTRSASAPPSDSA